MLGTIAWAALNTEVECPPSVGALVGAARPAAPSARLEERANRVLDEVGRRLKIGIRPFQQVRGRR
jgi:hypothetical protein